MNHLLFVYGSLKKGYENHYHLDGASYIGERSIKGKMYSLISFPYVNIEEKGIVKGELYKINDVTFKRCDILEGYPKFYNRKSVKTLEGEYVIVYYINKKNSNLVKSGVW